MEQHTYSIMFEVEGKHWWFAGRRRIIEGFVEKVCRDIGKLQLRILDVGCGTGALLSRLYQICPQAELVGVDPVPEMLAVARGKLSSSVELREAYAEQLPFKEESFDAIVSCNMFHYIRHPSAALKEMARVLRRGGRLAVAVWDDLDSSPGYAAMASLLQRLFGDTATRALQAPFALGAKQGLAQCLAAPDLVDVQIATHEGSAVFESIDAWVYTDIKGWTLAELIDDAQFAQLLEAARLEFRRFVEPDGRVVFRVPAHIASAVKR